MIFPLFFSLVILIIPQIVSAPETASWHLFLENEKFSKVDSQTAGDQVFIDSSKEVIRAPEKIESSRSLGIETTARAAVVLDKETGAVLFEKKIENKFPIASITKLMTALIFLDTNPDWEKKVKLIKEDEKEGGIFYARAGEELTIKDLFNMMLVGSVNNAAFALARSTGLSQEEFVEKMNQKAQTLGLKNTFFADPAGLEPANISTALEVAKLLSFALDKDEIREATVKKKYVFSPQNIEKKYYVKNTNELLWSFLNEPPYKIIGGKTGYLEEAKYNLALEVQNDGHRIIVVVLGSNTIEDRFQEVKGLTFWTFENYKW